MLGARVRIGPEIGREIHSAATDTHRKRRELGEPDEDAREKHHLEKSDGQLLVAGGYAAASLDPRRTRTIEASTIVNSASRSTASASRTCFQTPRLDQRRKRVCSSKPTES